MYDFRTLSPLDFELLVRDLLQAEFGLRLESFGPGRDMGIDFRFATAGGAAIVQAKHYPDVRTDSLVREAARENEKVKKLKPARYLFCTSASLTPQGKDKIKAALPDAPLELSDILGRADLNNLLTRHKEIEKQHFKLWLASTAVLERILHSGVYNRTQAEMDEIKAMVPKFVQNQSVPAAEAILEKHGALIIAGEPGIGKSTLARMLVWLHAEQDWRISVIDDISEAFEIADGSEKRLIFFDDFLGQVGLTRDLIRGVDQRFPPFFRRVKSNPNLRFVLTTRDYIFAQARAQSARLDSAQVNATEFVLNVSSYTRASRAQILFNHIYFSELSTDERAELLADDFFLKIIDHRNFNPRLIDLLTTPDYVSLAGRPIRETVTAVLENPHELWEKPYRSHISEEGRALMLALFFNAVRVAIPTLERSFGRMVEAFGFSFPRSDLPSKFRAALKELEGSVAAIQDRNVSFSNPGIRDFLSGAIRDDKMLAPVVGVIAEFNELKAAREYASRPHSPPIVVPQQVWVGAAGRLVNEGGGGSALAELNFVIGMYDDLQNEALVPIVQTAVASLEQSEIESGESDLCGEVLEQLVATLLPSEVQEEAKRVVTHSVATMLTNDGGQLTLDDLESLGDTFVKWGADEDLAIEAVKEALESHAFNLSDALSDMHSVDEIEGFEKQFLRLVDEYGARSRHAVEKFESRKEYIMESIDPNEEGYGRRGGGSTATVSGISDDQIRSMFSSIKGG